MNNDEWTGVTAWLLRPVVRFLFVRRDGRGLFGLVLIVSGGYEVITHHVFATFAVVLGLLLLLINGVTHTRRT